MVAADSKAKLQNEAEKYMLQGKIPQAIGEFLKIVQKDPEDILTLNTLGDLYLTIGKNVDANDCFIKVANKYVRNNFFLKAIAVYKKILRTDPDNLEINENIAALFAKQGLNIDACNQYLRLIKLYEQSGNSQEIIKTFEKIAELDPSNAAIQQKMAEISFTNGEKGKGCDHLRNAARALLKARDHAGAMACYERVVQIDPMDIDGLKGLKECCQKTGNIQILFDRLKETLASDPDNLDIKEMLGQVHLENKNPEAAAEILESVIASDEYRYQCFFPVAQAFIDLGDYERASEALDPIIPILITHRKTNIAAKHYEQILKHSVGHIPTMEKLASIYSAAGDIPSQLEIMDRIADRYIEQENRTAALVCLEKILQADPESKKHLDLHKKVFVEEHPDTPYVAPVVSTEEEVDRVSIQERQLTEEAAAAETPENIVEADLLINYGMKEKAFGLLKNLEAQDPNDKKVRIRLLSLFKEEKKFTEAAEQCLLLAALHRKSNDEDAVEKYISEAKQLDPVLVDKEKDLDLFARKRGVVTDSSSESGSSLKSDSEVDVLDIFFDGNKGALPGESTEMPTVPDEIPEEYPQGLPSAQRTQSVDEKLQEVDFYIRLGFNEEALNKLNEISKISPDNPELSPRYAKLNEMESAEAGGPTETADAENNPPEGSAEFSLGDEDATIFQDVDIDEALSSFSESPGDDPASQEETIEIEIPADSDMPLEAGFEETFEFPQSHQKDSPTDSADFSDFTDSADFADFALMDQPEDVPDEVSSDFALVEHQVDTAQQNDAMDMEFSGDGGTVPETDPSPEASGFAILEHLDGATDMEPAENIRSAQESVLTDTAQKPESLKESAPSADSTDYIVNDMFSDLLEEVSKQSDREISKESFEDHFSLGTAYRDMELIEEAIKEFQTALKITEFQKDARKMVQCCGMLSTCFLKKGMPRSALRWCKTGLNIKNITPQEAIALRYDMGVAHTLEGDKDLALRSFDQIFSIDPSFRDVAQKIDEIKSSRI